MQGQPKTSFIPKKPSETISTNVGVSTSSKKSVSKTIFSLVANIIFIATLVAVGGVYFYYFTLTQKIETQVASLKKAKEELEDRFITDASRLNLRINSAIELLDNHLSPSSLFTLLESYTLQTVSFSNFSFTDTKDGNILIKGSGDAKRFESIVLQSDAFGESSFIRGVLFSDLNPNIDRGVIEFTFTATLDPSLILYKNSLPQNFNNTEEI